MAGSAQITNKIESSHMNNETKKFLQALDPKTEKFTFQTFDEKGENKKLVRILHGTIEQHYDTLNALNKQGAGIYITVNETDLKGRKAENITRIRAVFADLDGAPLEPARQPRPHIIVESSPKRWHVYYLVSGMQVDAAVFRAAQRKLIKRLGSDPKITDLPRVLRLPGFMHMKGKPFRTKIVDIWDGGKPYKAEKFLGEVEKKPRKSRINNTAPVDVKEISAALEVLPADDYQVWFEVGCALHREFGDDGFELFDRWSRKSEKYDKRACEKKWDGCADVKGFSAGTIFFHATEAEPTWRELDEIPEGATVENFVSYLPRGDYIYTPTGQHWPAKSVNGRLPKQQAGTKYVKATDWLDRFRRVEAMTWSPGDPVMIANRLAVAEGGWIEEKGTTCFNSYRPPRVTAGDPKRASRWVDHVHRLFPSDCDHLLNWFALRVQKPGVKINHGLIIGGEQGIGKDMILKPVRNAVGTWNSLSVAPKDIMSNFNTYVRSVICQIDEARDLGDTRHYDFYEHLKTLTTAPPEILQCNEKHMSPYGVMNCTGVVITTNHRTGGVYLPPGDRRFYVAWSNRIKEEFSASYFTDLEAFYNNGGYAHIASYLRAYDVSRFNPKAPPPQTEAWKNIVEANLPAEDAEFAEALAILENPSAVTIEQIMKATPSNSFAQWLEERKSRRSFAHRLESCGYVAVRNDETGGHNRWRYRVSQGGTTVLKEIAIYVKSKLSPPAQNDAARQLVRHLQKNSEK